MKIVAVGNSNLVSSFMIAITLKKVLKKLNKDAEIEASDLTRLTDVENVDLFIIEQEAANKTTLPAGDSIVINNFINSNEVLEKLTHYFQT